MTEEERKELQQGAEAGHLWDTWEPGRLGSWLLRAPGLLPPFDLGATYYEVLQPRSPKP